MKRIIKVYFGCALTYANDDFKKEIAKLKERLAEVEGVKMLDFIGLENGTEQDVYNHDIHNCVGKADLIIGECSYPSLGLGWELGTAVERYQTPVLAVALKSSKVTRLVTGAVCDKNPHYSFKTYDTFRDLFFICVKKIKEIQKL